MCSKTPATFAIFPVPSLGYAHTQSRSFYPHSTVEAAHVRKSTRLSTPAQLQCSHSGTWEPGNETNNALHLFWYYDDQPHTPVSCQIVWKFLQEVLRTNLKDSCSEQDSNGLNCLGHSYFDPFLCMYYCHYYTSNLCECMGVNREASPAHSLWKAVFFTSHVRIRISTTSHARICIRYCKSRMLCLNVQWSQRSVW